MGARSLAWGLNLYLHSYFWFMNRAGSSESFGGSMPFHEVALIFMFHLMSL